MHRPTDAATMTKLFAIQEEDKGSKRRMENLPTDNRVGITDCNQSGSGQIMRITSCSASGSGTNNELYDRGRRDEHEEGMNIIVVGFNLNLKKTERETEDISKKKERERMMKKEIQWIDQLRNTHHEIAVKLTFRISKMLEQIGKSRVYRSISDQRGDVPGWVLVVLMTTGLVTAIWTIAAPRLTAILKNSLDAMNGIR